MDVFNDCIKEIRWFCEGCEYVPDGAYTLINYWIDCLNVWSCDKTIQQVENMLCVILKDYTGERYIYNWDLEQHIITVELLEIAGYNEAVEDYYNNYNESDEDFNRFWMSLNIPALEAEEINRRAMRCFGTYTMLLERLQEFAHIRNINFAECAKRAGLHEDFYKHLEIEIKGMGVPPLKAYIIKDSQKVLKAIDAELRNCIGKQGRKIALIICALEQYGYIANIDGNIERIYEAFKLSYPDKVSDNRQAVSTYLNAHRNLKAKTDKPPFTEAELRKFINKI